MTNSKNSLTLSKIQICAYSPDDEVAREFPAYEIFDDRHDFPISSTQSGVAVIVTNVNLPPIMSVVCAVPYQSR